MLVQDKTSWKLIFVPVLAAVSMMNLLRTIEALRAWDNYAADPNVSLQLQ